MANNIEALRKQYDKLTPPERFAAISAAIVRKDEAEHQALLKSAPRKTFSVPHTWGMIAGWEMLSAWYMASQLADATAFFMVLQFDDEADEEGKYFEAEGLLNRRILTRSQAWLELCQEYQVDSALMLDPYPGYELLEVLEPMMAVAKDGMTGSSEPERADVDKELASMRELIAASRKEWE